MEIPTLQKILNQFRPKHPKSNRLLTRNNK
jgi:hypothetical protein